MQCPIDCCERNDSAVTRPNSGTRPAPAVEQESAQCKREHDPQLPPIEPMQQVLTLLAPQQVVDRLCLTLELSLFKQEVLVTGVEWSQMTWKVAKGNQ